MQEFDKFVQKEIADSLQQKKTQESHQNETNTEYEKFRSRKRKAKQK
jgi:hypothetical protein